MTKHAVALLARIRDAAAAGRVLDGGDAAVLVATIDRALAGERLEAALGLPGGWQNHHLAGLRRSEVKALAGSQGSASSIAKTLHSSLSRYAATRFVADRDRGFEPPGENGALYRILVASRGRVPSIRTLRRLQSM